jgi:putative Mn2+ efflux pump MntP
MSWLGLLTIAIALAMDAFAVAVVVGLTLQVLTKRHLFRLSFHFGLFQAAMLAAGWLVGDALRTFLAAASYWIAFILLLLVGGNVIRSAFQGVNEKKRSALDPTSGWQLVFLSFATSIDALAVGLSLAMLGTSIAISAFVVGFMATILTLLGMTLGRHISALWGKWVEVFGGLMLIAIGLKIVWDHMRA